MQKSDERRASLLADLTGAGGPVSASKLAARYNVSRQIIVGDIALLRASGEDITATPRGYILKLTPGGIIRRLACVHTPEQMEDELNIMVDNGITVENVIVEHPVYGQLTGQLHLSSRYDVQQFMRKLEGTSAAPLSDLTGGVHLHTLLCSDEAAFARVKDALAAKGYLYGEKSC
ncbi:MAG: transcription repressor NadR [Firmicutes bacterium]|nr:transcription repressor NadR [Bacillota bacterium]